MPQARQSARTRARLQRERDRARAANRAFESIAKDFEQHMMSLGFGVCSDCHKKTLSTDLVRSLCGKCRRTRKRLFSPENNMNIGEIPPDLMDLSLLEELLIARVHPVVSVFKIRGQQRGYSGHVMNFVQNVNQVASALPHRIENINSIVLLNRSTPNGLIQFRVRALKVKKALEWLKSNNVYYRDVSLDRAALDSLPADSDAVSLLPCLPGESDSAEQVQPVEVNNDNDDIIHSSCFPNIPTVDQEAIIQRNLRRMMSNPEVHEVQEAAWPDISQSPLDEFRTEGLICQAFPRLFPYGRGDLNAPRVEKISNHEYFKYLMRYKDNRFSSDVRFPYYAYNSLARYNALNIGNTYVRHHSMEGVTAEDVAQILEDSDRNLASSIMYYGAALRGTRSYWRQRCTELTQMVRQLGTPTIFFTLSAADYHWPDLFRLINPSLDISTLTEKQRRALMHENPCTVAWFFDQRCDAFLKKFIRKWFAVKDWWYRYEWQHRGSPHIHGVLWFENAPDCSDIDSLDEESRGDIVSYFDTIISATIEQNYLILPDTNPCRKRYCQLTLLEKEFDLDRMLSAVQRHSVCGSHCLRRARNSRVRTCRYKFPKDLEDEASMRKVDGSWTFIPRRNDALLQRYNRAITQVWRGNTDFSAITSKDAVINYISKYAAKCEHGSEDYTEILRRIVSRNLDTAPASTLIRQLLISSVAERNYSAQEVMHLIMGWPLFHASRTFIVLSLNREWQQLGGTNESLYKRYSTRPDGFAELTLWNFARSYRLERGQVKQRAKECIVRVVPFLKLSETAPENEFYYRQQYELHVPWRGNIDDLLPPGMSWEHFFLSRPEAMQNREQNEEVFPHPPDEVEFDNSDDPVESNIRDAAMAASRLHPQIRVTDPIGYRPVDEAFIWNTLDSVNFTEEDLMSFLAMYQTIPNQAITSRSCLPESFMNSSQQTVLNICREQLALDPFTVKRVIVQGKAGTGKSALIASLCKLINQSFPYGDAYEVLAPTGAAAVNVDGKTIHSLLKIPINSQLLPLNGESLRALQIRFKNIRFVIIDEYSMVGLRMLHKIHSRLCEARGSTSEPFGGYNIYLFGDLRQLPPVKDLAIYSTPPDDYSRLGLRLIQSFQKFIILDTVYRQESAQTDFKRALDNIACGMPTQDDWRLLMSRRSAINAGFEAAFKDAIYLFPTNQAANDHNLTTLAKNRQPVAVIDAIHNNSTARQGSEVLAGGLSRTLHLSIGCRVMLRKNLCVEKSLVNGSVGTVADIVYHSGQSPPSLPYAIFVNFDKYRGPFMRHGLFPILPTSSSWKDQGVECSRTQFPLTLAYALTIHKSQGLTLEKAVVTIGDKEMAPGLTYVALSRVRRIEDLIIARAFDFTRLSAIGQNRQIKSREDLLRRFSVLGNA